MAVSVDSIRTGIPNEDNKYGRSPIAVGPQKVVTLGASITNGSSSTNAGTLSYSPMLGKTASMQRIDRVVEFFGYPGQQADYIYGQIGTALAAKPDILILGPDFGTNGADSSAGTAGEVWTYYGYYVQACAKMCRAAGVRMIACATLPQGVETANANVHIGIARQKQWLFSVGAKLGIEAIDTHTEMLDHTTGYLSTSYYAGADPVHPTDAGHAQLATLIANYLDAAPVSANQAKMLWPVAVGPSGLAPNPLNTGTTSTGWATTISPSTFTGTATHSLEARLSAADLPAGRWHKVNCDASAAGGTLRSGTSNIAVTPGETLWFYGWAKSDGTGTASVIVWNGSTNALASTIVTLTNGAASIPFSQRFTVPVGCTNIRLALNLVTTVGQNLNGYMGAYDVVRPSYLAAV